jgi:hypothetical protein
MRGCMHQNTCKWCKATCFVLLQLMAGALPACPFDRAPIPRQPIDAFPPNFKLMDVVRAERGKATGSEAGAAALRLQPDELDADVHPCLGIGAPSFDPAGGGAASPPWRASTPAPPRPRATSMHHIPASPLNRPATRPPTRPRRQRPAPARSPAACRRAPRRSGARSTRRRRAPRHSWATTCCSARAAGARPTTARSRSRAARTTTSIMRSRCGTLFPSSCPLGSICIVFACGVIPSGIVKPVRCKFHSIVMSWCLRRHGALCNGRQAQRRRAVLPLVRGV